MRPTVPARTPPLPAFAEFYSAINGRDPFPWQTRLADCIVRNEQWPPEIGVPTGLGKTACLDIAVWWLASQSDRTPERRTAPTRIWWVVNRRLLVDSTANHARHIAGALRHPESTRSNDAGQLAIECVAARLRSLWVDPAAPPLDVISLRGGIASRTPTDPARPTVVLCTVPMYGSRLLFRGYGSSRPAVDAAMAGTDSLVLLDEAHLAGHLRALVPALAECSPNALELLGPERSRPTVVSLTATGDTAPNKRFDLDDDDEAHPVVRQRLDASKPLLVVETVDGKPAKRLAETTLALVREASGPAACLVFGNTPKTARQTSEHLRKAMPEAEVLLLTGLAREREAERIRGRILDPEHGMATTRCTAAPRRRYAEYNYMILRYFSSVCPVRVRNWVLASAQDFGRLRATLWGHGARGVASSVKIRSCRGDTQESRRKPAAERGMDWSDVPTSLVDRPLPTARPNLYRPPRLPTARPGEDGLLQRGTLHATTAQFGSGTRDSAPWPSRIAGGNCRATWCRS